jgi:hypothetical protein
MLFNNQGHLGDGTRRNAVPEVLPQKDKPEQRSEIFFP